VTVVELRVLDGPNLYFTRPAIKLTLGVAPWLALPDERAQRLTRRAGFTPVATAGAPNSDQRRRYVARFAVHVARLLADATARHLAIRGRPGPDAEQIVVAFVWRRQQAAEAFAEHGCDPFNDLVGRAEEINGRVVLVRGPDQALE